MRRKTVKKHMAFLIALAVTAGSLGLSGSGIVTSYAAAKEDKEPILVYNFDEEYTAGVAEDSEGYNDAILSEEAVYVHDDEYGQVLYLDGGTEVGGHNSFLEFPEGFFDGMDKMTISMDVNEVTRSGYYFTFTIGQDNNSYLFLKTDPTAMKLAITTSGSAGEDIADASFVYPNNSREWINVKMVITPYSLSLYQDGRLLAENKYVNTAISDLGEYLKAYIGKSFYSADKYFRGYFDNVKVYDYAMTAEEVAEITEQETAAREAAMSDLNYVAEHLEIPNADNIRGNITLPDEKNGVEIDWTSSNEKVISTEVKENAGYDPTPAGVVKRQKEDTPVTLTAVFSKDGKSVTKTYDILVKAEVEIEDEEYMGYLFVRFTGTEATSLEEQTYFSISEDGLNWKDLNGGDPVLVSNIGESGLRDHYIGRTAEGDKFYMIATDLSMYHGQWNWPDARRNGGNGIVVWESEDLVNWSEPWIAELAPDNNGCTWAPEFIYDEETGEYIVFWSATTIELDENENITQEYENYAIYYAKTRDFRTFTKAKMYQPDPKELTGGTREKVIDSTVIYHDGTYYRYTKNEGNGKIQVDCSDSMLGTFTDIESTTLNKTLPNKYSGVEGPIIFKMNEKTEDGQDQWCLMVDRFIRAEGYYPLITTDLASGEFRMLDNSEFSFPEKYRHGYVLPITATEYHMLQAKWGDSSYFSTYLLEKAIKEAKALDWTLYTEESYQVLESAIEAAETVAAEAKKMQEVKDAIADLQAAVESLVLLEDVIELPYNDVKDDEWYYDAVYYNYLAGTMTGMTADTFEPDKSLVRGQFASIIHRMEGEPKVEFAPEFPDVEKDAWYATAVLWAKSAGVVNGYQSGNFGPADNIVREQMAVMMYNYAEFKGYDVSAANDLSAFGDAELVSAYALPAMKWAVGAGIISGKGGTMLAPHAETTRAECAAIIRNFAEKYN